MENIASVSATVANVLLSVFLIAAIVLIVWLVCYSFIISYKNEKKYQESVMTILKSGCDYEIAKKQFKQVFQSYSTKNCSYLNLIQLNSRLIEKLRDKKIANCNNNEIVKYCDVLTKLNDDFNDELLYSDEKLSDLLNQTDDNSLKESIKSMYLCINSYNDGRIYEKNCEIQKLNTDIEKSKKRNIISIAAGIVGFVSGLIRIIQAFI